VCPLPEILELKRRHDFVLMVDEAHSFGVMGTRGRGIDEHFGVDPSQVDVWTASLGKAVPATGGFLAASRALTVYFQHEAAPFMFSGALCPPATAAARAALRVIDSEPWRIGRLRHVISRLHSGLQALGFNTGTSETAVIPVILGSEARTLGAARALLDRGVFTTAVVHPAVPGGSARLRLCAMATHTDEDIDHALDAFAHLRTSL
jgi:7-keto-8-aminopelargonate synthetase-like enzyme